MVRFHTVWILYYLWQAYSTKSRQTCCLMPHGVGTAVAVPVTRCTVWKGTSQDCIDHMRKAHDTPHLVKVANLARWFPPWTVSREQWSSLTRSAVSGIAVDICCSAALGCHCFTGIGFSIGTHGTHAAFRGTYMQLTDAYFSEGI